jgi:hypothetical protein
MTGTQLIKPNRSFTAGCCLCLTDANIRIFLSIHEITKGVNRGAFHFFIPSYPYPKLKFKQRIKNSCSYRKNPVAIHFVDYLPHTYIERKTPRYETHKTPKVQNQGIAGKLCYYKEHYQDYYCQ